MWTTFVPFKYGIISKDCVKTKKNNKLTYLCVSRFSYSEHQVVQLEMDIVYVIIIIIMRTMLFKNKK